jgi:hypothetical protein
MGKIVRFTINGRETAAASDSTLAAALLNAGVTSFRRSVNGEPRGPLCGMGICFECRVTIEGHPYQKSCQIFCADGMVVIAE